MAAVVGAWLCDRDRHNRHPQRRRQAVCVDGKTLRGARRPPAADGEGRPVHLLAAMGHATRAVLAQQQVGGAPEEVPAFQPLLANLDLAGTVVTADALQTHPAAAEFLVTGKQAHYLFAVKANQRPPCWTAAPAYPGIACPCWTAPATAATAAWRSAPSRRSPSTTSGSPTPPRSSRSPARPGTCALWPHPGGGGP
jgi:hypothetical protein